jgi:hypothetical protein
MKRSRKVALAILTILGVGACIFWPTNPIQYIQETTGIIFPIAAFDIDVYDNGENYVVAHLAFQKNHYPHLRQLIHFSNGNFRALQSLAANPREALTRVRGARRSQVKLIMELQGDLQ